MTNETTTSEKFNYIMFEPFYSSIHRCSVWVDENRDMYVTSQEFDLFGNRNWELHTSNLTDGMIEVLYRELKEKVQNIRERIFQ